MSAALLLRAFSPNMTPEDWLVIARDAVIRVVCPLVAVSIGMAALSLALQVGMTQLGLSIEKVGPDFKRLNPISKLKNIAN